MSDKNPPPSDEPLDHSERLAELHASLSEGTQPGTGPDQIEPELQPTVDVLKLIERVRRRDAASPSAAKDRIDGATPVSDDTTNLARVFEDATVGELPASIGRFAVIRQLGQGGYGIVLLAFDPQLKREVALKVPHPAALMTAELRARFVREAEAAAALNHPNVVPVFEVGSIGPVAYIASAYCQGMALDEWLQKAEGLPSPRQAARLVATLADAVQHAHSRGVLHRDLKPANVLLETDLDPASMNLLGGDSITMQDIARSARITDFGLAKIDDDKLAKTQTGAVLGTPSYMSPEQSEGGIVAVGPATDVYALGAILYELLVGRPPFQADSVLATLQAVRQQDPVAPRRLQPEIPRDLEAICLRCLEKRPEHRFESASELESDLRRFLAGEPVRARRVTAVERLLRWCRRNPLVASLTAAVFALAVGSTVAAVQLAKSRQETVAHLNDALVAEGIATRNEFESRIAQAHAVRRSHSPGQRVITLDALRRAMELSEQMVLSEKRKLELRNEVIASLSLVDLRPDKKWPIHVAGDSFLDTDADCRRYAHVDEDSSQVFVRSMETNEILSRLPIDGEWRRFIGFRFSPDGRILGARYERSPGNERLQLWTIADAKSIASVPVGGFGSAADFGDDGRFIAYAVAGKNLVEIRSLPAFELLETLPFPAMPVVLACHPTQPWLACYNGVKLEICHIETGRIMAQASLDSHVYRMVWNPRRDQLAVGSRNGIVRLFSLRLKEGGAGEMTDRILDGHSSMVTNVAWHPNGDLLASCAMDGTTQLWDSDTGTKILTAEGTMTSFSRDGRWLGTHGGRWQVVLSDEHLATDQPDVSVDSRLGVGFTMRNGVTSEIDYWETFPHGRIVVGQNFFGFVFRDAMVDEPLAEIPLDGCWMRFSPDGSAMYTVSDRKGISRLPIRISESQEEIVMRIGPPEHLMDVPPGPFAFSHDGSVMLSPFLGTGQLIDTNTWSVRTSLTPTHPLLFWSDITRDGRYVATGTFKGKDVQIRDAHTGKLVKRIKADTAAVWFSPDNQLFAVAENGRYRFWKVGTWEQVHELVSVPGGIFPCSLGFSHDGGLVAVEDGTVVRLLETRGFSEVASFRVPAGELIDSVRLTATGDYLIVGGGDVGHTHVWNLRRIRAQLGEMGLGWPQSDYTGPRLHPSKPIRLHVQMGDMGQRTGRSSISISKLISWKPVNLQERDLKVLTERAQRSVRGEFYASAIRDFSRLMELTDDSQLRATALHWRGICRARRQGEKDVAKAIEDQEAALELNPSLRNAHNSLAWLYVAGPLNLRDPEKAIRHAETAARADPDRWAYQKTLGAAYYRGARYQEAVATLEQAHRCGNRQFPSIHLLFLAMSYHHLKNEDSARLCYYAADEWWHLLQVSSPEFRRRELRQLREEASRVLGLKVVSSPRERVSRKLASDLAKARASIAERPKDYRRWLTMARLLHRWRMYHASALDSAVIVARAPDLNHGYYLRGLSHLSSGRHVLAMDDLEKSLALSPDDGFSQRHLAWAILFGPPAARDPQRAESLSSSAVKSTPTNAVFLQIHGIALCRNKKFLEANEQLRLAEEIAPGSPVCHYHLAISHARLHDPQAALSHFLRAERLSPTYSGASSEDLNAIRAEARNALKLGEAGE